MIKDIEDIGILNLDKPEANVPEKKDFLKNPRFNRNPHRVGLSKVERNYNDYNPDVPSSINVYLKTYGCAHNVSDSEYMLGQLQTAGYNIVEEEQESDLIVLNTCTAKGPSESSFFNYAKKLKESGKHVVATGCVVQADEKYKDYYSVLGVRSIDKIVEVVDKTVRGLKVEIMDRKGLPSLDIPKIRYNKLIEIVIINTGCLGSCTYCKIRHARGNLESYTVSDILKRVGDSLERGATEIWLMSEDTGAYGLDIDTNIVNLCKSIFDLFKTKGCWNAMLRIGNTNPPYMLSQLQGITEVLNHPQCYKYLHIPVQSGSNDVLYAMNREYTVEEFRVCVDYLLKRVPGLQIATDIIVGFPGESVANFEESFSLLDDYKFRNVNIAQFYPRSGTPAVNYPNQVDAKDKKKRSKILSEHYMSYTKYDNYKNLKFKIYVTEYNQNNNQYVGHTDNYSKVVLEYQHVLDMGLKEFIIGSVLYVEVIEFDKFHLKGKILKRVSDKEMKNSIINYRYKGYQSNYILTLIVSIFIIVAIQYLSIVLFGSNLMNYININ